MLTFSIPRDCTAFCKMVVPAEKKVKCQKCQELSEKLGQRRGREAKQMRSSRRVPEDERGAGGAVRVACFPSPPSTRASRVFICNMLRMLAVLDGGA
jgi:hypothetical protein